MRKLSDFTDIAKLEQFAKDEAFRCLSNMGIVYSENEFDAGGVFVGPRESDGKISIKFYPAEFLYQHYVVTIVPGDIMDTFDVCNGITTKAVPSGWPVSPVDNDDDDNFGIDEIDGSKVEGILTALSRYFEANNETVNWGECNIVVSTAEVATAENSLLYAEDLAINETGYLTWYLVEIFSKLDGTREVHQIITETKDGDFYPWKN